MGIGVFGCIKLSSASWKFCVTKASAIRISSTTMRKYDDLDRLIHVTAPVDRMRLEDFLCDFKIEVGNKSIYVHRLILAANSDYFKSNMKEAEERRLRIDNIEADVVEKCMEFIYAFKCNITSDSISKILHAASFLQIYGLQEKYFEFMRNILCPENSLSILNLARNFHCPVVEKAADVMVMKNLEIVMSTDLELFQAIIKKDLVRYISDVKFTTCWKAVLCWSQGRAGKFGNLVDHIHFRKYSFDFLLYTVLTEPLVAKSQRIKSVVVGALFSNPVTVGENLSRKNCFHLNELAPNKDSKNIIASFMKRNFQSLIAEPKFVAITKEDFVILVSSFEVKSEELKWNAIIKWVKHNSDDRTKFFPELFRHLKLEMLPIRFLKETIRCEGLVKHGTGCMEILVDTLFNYIEEPLSEDDEYENQFREFIKKPQPPDGRINQVADGYLPVYFPAGVYDGVRISEYERIFFISSSNLEQRLIHAFKKRRLFVLEHKEGSKQGKIVTGEVPLDSSYTRSAIFLARRMSIQCKILTLQSGSELLKLKQLLLTNFFSKITLCFSKSKV